MSVTASSALSDTGRRRRRNEDAFYCEPPLFAVADGMGGAQAGEVASQLAAESLREHESGDLPAAEQVVDLIRAANRRVHSYSSQNLSARGMGTTMTVALVDNGAIVIGHVGDSRAYLLRDGSLEQLTQDHSLVAELVRSGRLSPEEAETHPQRSVITRALGTDAEVDVDVFSIRARDGDLVLLCSDGLTSMLGNDEIERTLIEKRAVLDGAAEELVRAANEAGGEDNITVVLFELSASPEEAGGDGEGGEGDEAKTLTEIDAVPAIRVEHPPRLHPLRLTLTAATVAVVVVGVALSAWALSRSHFVGVEPDGHVAVYQGLPYALPGGIELYRPVHVSGRLFASQLSERERASLFGHDLSSYNDSLAKVNRYEEAVYP